MGYSNGQKVAISVWERVAHGSHLRVRNGFGPRRWPETPETETVPRFQTSNVYWAVSGVWRTARPLVNERRCRQILRLAPRTAYAQSTRRRSSAPIPLVDPLPLVRKPFATTSGKCPFVRTATLRMAMRPNGPIKPADIQEAIRDETQDPQRGQRATFFNSDHSWSWKKPVFGGTLAIMRRIWAALLVVVFSFALPGPDAFASFADRKLPPCCRSNGKHHCALAQTERGSSGPAFQSGKCPLFSSDQTMPPLSAAAIPKLSAGILGAILSHPTPHPQPTALGRAAFDRTGQKRGPPALS